MKHVIRIAKTFEYFKIRIDQILNRIPPYLTGENFQYQSDILNQEFSELNDLQYYFDINHSLFHELYDEITSQDFDRRLCTDLFRGIQSFYQSIIITNSLGFNISNVMLDRNLYLKPESNKEFRDRVNQYCARFECNEDEAYDIAFNEYRKYQISDITGVTKEVVEKSVKNYVAYRYWLVIRRLYDSNCFMNNEIDHIPLNATMGFNIFSNVDLMRLYDGLVNYGFISRDTVQESFVKIFDGTGQKEKDFIIWTDYQDSKESNKTTLLYLIDIMLLEHNNSSLKNQFICDFFKAGESNLNATLNKDNLNRSRYRLNNLVRKNHSRLLELEKLVNS